MRIAHFIAATAIAALPFAASAATLTGSYSLGPGNDNNQAVDNGNGTFHLTATDSTFSYVEFKPNQTITFSQLTDLNAVFTQNRGDSGAGGGSPRLSIGLDNGGTEAFLHILLGDSPAFTANLAGYSGFNVIGNNDAGRYDTSQFAGGSPFTTYADSLGLIGSLNIEEIDFVSDTFGNFGDRDLILNSINASFTPSAVPEPASLALFGAGLFGLGFIRRRRAA